MSKEKPHKKSGGETPKKKIRFKIPFMKKTTLFEQRNGVIHEPNPRFSLPYKLHIPGEHLPSELEKHFQTHQVIVPWLDDGCKATWKVLEELNPLLVDLRLRIIDLDGRDYPDQAWDNIAHKLTKMVYKHHEQKVLHVQSEEMTKEKELVAS